MIVTVEEFLGLDYCGVSWRPSRRWRFSTAAFDRGMTPFNREFGEVASCLINISAWVELVGRQGRVGAAADVLRNGIEFPWEALTARAENIRIASLPATW